MSSANTVAQKPAGNFNPLSLLAHAWLFAFASALDGLWAETTGLPANDTVRTKMTGNRILDKPDNRMGMLLTI
jgi:hypothetical protein